MQSNGIARRGRVVEEDLVTRDMVRLRIAEIRNSEFGYVVSSIVQLGSLYEYCFEYERYRLGEGPGALDAYDYRNAANNPDTHFESHLFHFVVSR